MPLVSIVVHGRGWGKTPDEAKAHALGRLRRFVEKAEADKFHIERGLATLVEDPGNGGPCGPVSVRTQKFEYLIAIEDLPEFEERDRKPGR